MVGRAEFWRSRRGVERHVAVSWVAVRQVGQGKVRSVTAGLGQLGYGMSVGVRYDTVRHGGVGQGGQGTACRVELSHGGSW